jgi:signal transduction histidine kinase
MPISQELIEKYPYLEGHDIASYSDIVEVATETEKLLNVDIQTVKPLLKQAYLDFRNSLQPPENNFWLGNKSEFFNFWKDLQSINKIISSDGTNLLRNLMFSKSGENPDYRELSTFLTHDLRYLRPIYLYNLLTEVDNHLHMTGKLEIHDRHLQFFDELSENNFKLLDQMVYPIRFVREIADLENSHRIKKENFKPIEDIYNIALWIKGALFTEDFDININTGSKADQSANCININCDTDLNIKASRSMLFLTLFNIINNAAKAQAFTHERVDDSSIVKLYENQGKQEHPRSITIDIQKSGDNLVFKIKDEGSGISLDDSLNRFHTSLIQQLEYKTPDQIRNSVWYWNMRKKIGIKQTECLMSWPSNPDILRKINVGSILDCQFLQWFSREGLQIPSAISGLGLWGVRYISDRLGGMVIATNSFNGGAIISLIIPLRNLGIK